MKIIKLKDLLNEASWEDISSSSLRGYGNEPDAPSGDDPAKAERELLIKLKDDIIKQFKWEQIGEEKSFDGRPIKFYLEKGYGKGVFGRLSLELIQRQGVATMCIVGAKTQKRKTSKGKEKAGFVGVIKSSGSFVKLGETDTNIIKKIDDKANEFAKSVFKDPILYKKIQNIIQTGKRI